MLIGPLARIVFNPVLLIAVNNLDDMGWSSGAGELNVGRTIGITSDHFYGGPLNMYSHLEVSKSKI